VDGAHVVERAAVALDVLDHEVVLTAHQVLDTDLLACLKLPAEYVLNPLACLGLRPEVSGGVRVNSSPAYSPSSMSQPQRLYSPFVLSLDSISESLPTYSPGGRGS
jgi:hypothetical protein